MNGGLKGKVRKVIGGGGGGDRIWMEWRVMSVSSSNKLVDDIPSHNTLLRNRPSTK